MEKTIDLPLLSPLLSLFPPPCASLPPLLSLSPVHENPRSHSARRFNLFFFLNKRSQTLYRGGGRDGGCGGDRGDDHGCHGGGGRRGGGQGGYAPRGRVPRAGNSYASSGRGSYTSSGYTPSDASSLAGEIDRSLCLTEQPDVGSGSGADVAVAESAGSLAVTVPSSLPPASSKALVHAR